MRGLRQSEDQGLSGWGVGSWGGTGPPSQLGSGPRAEREMLGFQGSQAYLVTPVKEVLQGYQGNRGSPGLQAVQVSIGRCQELRQVWDVSTYKGIISLVLLWVLTGARLLGQGHCYSQHSK